MNKSVFFSILSLVLISCVPARKFEELQAKHDECQESLSKYRNQSEDFETKNNELSNEVAQLKRDIQALERDTTTLGISVRKLNKQYGQINRLNDELLRKHAELKKGSREESAKLTAELADTRQRLLRKEDELKDLEQELNKKKSNLDQLQLDMQDRERRLAELEDMLAQKEAATKALKDKIASALLSFKDKGLTVEERNGKVYVSLDAKLLFASGSTKVDSEGKEALTSLAKVLEEQPDIEILVEGHTDTDKFGAKTNMKDNWDLSVLRATSVVRIIMDNSSVDPKRLTAAGRGEYLPIDEDKAKNRRIEIILTPKLDELFEMISN
jgi:chemotaxis protein MotB